MANIQVTTNQNIIEVVESGGITVTTPEGQTINVEVAASGVNVTNTTDDITVLTNGTLNITTGITDRLVAGSNQVILNTNATMTFPNNVIDFGSQTADLKSSSYSELWYRNATATPPPGQGIQTYIWAWENQAGIAVESVDNGYKEWFFNADATTQFPNYKFPAADGSANQILKTNGSGVLAWYSPSDANTTYTIDATTATGGANFNLVGSDATTDSIKIASGTNITVSRTDANTITIDGSDLNTTYTIASAATSGGANLTLIGSDASTDSVAYLGSGATTVTSTNANTITIASTDTNTTYTQNASTVSGGANLNLVGSDSTTDSIKLASGSNVTVTRTDADTVTIASTDTNTTYTQNFSATSGGANLNLVGSDATTDTVKFADGTGVTVTRTDADTATIAIGQSVGTGDSPSFAGITGGNITVGVATDNTITTTTGDLILDSTSGTVKINSNGTLGFTLNPITGFNPNADFTGNIVKGAIRSGTAEANGNIFEITGGIGSVGVSVDNTDKVASRTAVVMRNYGGSLATGTPRNIIFMESARGTAASPSNLVITNNLLELQGSGYTSTGFITDLVAVAPGIIRMIAAEAFSNGINNVGTTFQVLTQPTATLLTTSSIQATISINPQTGSLRTDTLSILNKAGSSTLTVGSTGTFNLLNGSGQTFLDVRADDGSGKPTLSVKKTNSTSANEYALINFDTQRSSGGTYTPTQSGDVIGQFKFNGNALSGASPGGTTGPGVAITAQARETWTTTAQGSAVIFGANKIGAITQTTVINASPDTTTFSSDIITLENAAGTDYAILNSSGTALTGDLDVRGGDITNSTGALQITSGATNTNITLDPDGTGNVVMTLANGGNLTNDRNYVFGAVRNSTTAGLGDIWAVNSTGSTNPFRGISLDNSADITKGPGTVLRSYGTAQGLRGRLIFERARGTAASPAALAAGDQIGSIDATGYTSTGWINDNVASVVPAFFGFSASENWVSNTNLGTNFTLSMSPTATTITSAANLISVLQIQPESLSLRSDRFAISQGKTVGFTATGCSTSGTTLTIGTLVTGTIAVGQVLTTTNAINGQYILANISGSGSGSTWTLGGSPGTLSGQAITGSVGYIGSVPATSTTTDILQDLRLVRNTIKGSTGTTQITTSASGTTLALAGDTITLENAAGTDYAVLNSTSATFTQPVGFPVKTVAQWGAISGVAGQQVCVSNSSTSPTQSEDGMMAYWGTTATAGWKYIHDNRAI